MITYAACLRLSCHRTSHKFRGTSFELFLLHCHSPDVTQSATHICYTDFASLSCRTSLRPLDKSMPTMHLKYERQRQNILEWLRHCLPQLAAKPSLLVTGGTAPSSLPVDLGARRPPEAMFQLWPLGCSAALAKLLV